MIGYIFPLSHDDEPKKSLTPEEIRKNNNAAYAGTCIILPSTFLLIGLFVLAGGMFYKNVWVNIIGLVIIFLSFFSIFFAEGANDVYTKVIRVYGGVPFSLILFASAFLLLLTGHFITGAILYLMGFLMAFRVTKAYGICMAIILLGLHSITLFE